MKKIALILLSITSIVAGKLPAAIANPTFTVSLDSTASDLGEYINYKIIEQGPVRCEEYTYNRYGCKAEISFLTDAPAPEDTLSGERLVWLETATYQAFCAIRDPLVTDPEIIQEITDYGVRFNVIEDDQHYPDPQEFSYSQSGPHYHYIFSYLCSGS